MKSARFILIAVAIVAMVIAAFWFSPRSQSFATPDQCIQAFYDAAKSGNAESYLACIAPKLQSALRKQYPDDSQLAEYLKSTSKDIMNWAQMGRTEIDSSTATITMIETRKNTSEQISYRFEKSGGNWQIVSMDAPTKIKTLLPYGIHEKEVWKNK